MSKAWKILKTIFWAMVIVASIFIIFTSLSLFGYQMFIVKSGSMEPKIHTGSIVIDHKESNYNLKNVITFKIKGSKDTVTHRIVQVKTANGVVSYFVKGDANKTPDPDPVLKTNVVGKETFTVPFIGYLIAFIRTLPGLIIFIVVPALIIVSDEIGNIRDEVKKIKNKDDDIEKKMADLTAREAKLEADEKRLKDQLDKKPKNLKAS